MTRYVTSIPWVPRQLPGYVALWNARDEAARRGLTTAQTAALDSWQDELRSFDVAQATGSLQPTLMHDGIRYVERFTGSEYLVGTGNLSSSHTGFFGITVARLRSLDNQTLFSVAEAPSTNRFFNVGIVSTGGNGYLTVRRSTAGPSVINAVRGSTALPLNEPLLLEVWSSGTAWSLAVNGVAETLVVAAGSNTGDWIGDIPSRNRWSIGARHNGDFACNADICSVFLSDAVPV